jgi:hypothetical protein
MTVRVFVSSTFTDLIPFRESVQKAIRQLGTVDISMENFGARDERPKDECLRLIKEESDIFVGIYAHRYGFIPAGDQISITELEYEAALSVEIPTLIYLIDDSAPWIPAHIDRGHLEANLVSFKNRLRANHICEFFSGKDELAAKVVADLGRHLSRQDIAAGLVRTFEHMDSEREYRLIQDLKSSDKYEIKRSIAALTRSHSPWLTHYLAGLVVGQDEELADLALSALREIPGRDSAKAIATGLNSKISNVRSMAAFTLGEMALFGRRKDSESTLGPLIAALQNTTEDIRVLDEGVHSLGKIGGKQALDSLVKILKHNGTPTQLKAKALHGPGRFWGAREYSHFVSLATEIVKQWSIDTCRSVSQDHIFKYISNPLKQLVESRSLEG